MIELRTRQGRVLHRANATGFDLKKFLAEAVAIGARNHKPVLGEPWPKELPSLAGADLDDLRKQLRQAGVAQALTADGRLNLRGFDLSFYDLSRVEARQVDLSMASLERTILAEATFDSARMAGARLSGAWAPGIRCERADLRGAVMESRERKETDPPLPEEFCNGRSKDLTEDPVMMRMGHFEDARLDGASLRSVKAAEAKFAGTNLVRAKVSDCEFTDAAFHDTDVRWGEWTRNDMVTKHVTELETTGATLHGNTYVKIDAKSLLGLATGKEELRHAVTNLSTEMQADFWYGQAVRLITKKLAETAAAGLPVAAVAGQLGSRLGSMVDLGEISKKVVEKVYEEIHAAAYGTSENVDKAKDWLAGKGLVVATGSCSERLRAEVLKDGQRRRVQSISFDGATVTIASRGDINRLLYKAGLLDGFGEWTGPRTRLEREAGLGGGYPDETAPSAIDIRSDRATTAHWRDRNGDKLVSVRYDSKGQPQQLIDHRTGTISAARDAEDPFFTRRRAVLEDWKDGMVRALLPHDSETHLAVMQKDGAIMVRCRATGTLDNGAGRPAVRLPDGTGLHFQNGVKVAAAANGPEPVGARRI